jgi:hypothetical protein
VGGGRRYREERVDSREGKIMVQWKYGVKRNNNNNFLKLAEIKNNRPRGLETHTKTFKRTFPISSKTAQCSVNVVQTAA